MMSDGAGSSKQSSSKPKKQADFEYQELKILLETMKRERVPSRYELTAYLRGPHVLICDCQRLFLA